MTAEQSSSSPRTAASSTTPDPPKEEFRFSGTTSFNFHFFDTSHFLGTFFLTLTPVVVIQLISSSHFEIKLRTICTFEKIRIDRHGVDKSSLIIVPLLN